MDRIIGSGGLTAKTAFFKCNSSKVKIQKETRVTLCVYFLSLQPELVVRKWAEIKRNRSSSWRNFRRSIR